MKIELLPDDSYTIFLNQKYIKNLSFKDKSKIISEVRDFILKYKTRLHLRGFYKVKVYVNEKVGLFFDIIKLDDLDFSYGVDLRVIVYLDETILFETEYYDILPERVMKRYYQGKFYVDVDSLKKLEKFVDFGRFIYGDEVLKILNQGRVV